MSLTPKSRRRWRSAKRPAASQPPRRSSMSQSSSNMRWARYRSSSVLRFLCASLEMLGWGAEEKTERDFARTDPPRVGRCLRNMAASSKRIGSETKMMCAAGPAGMSAGPSGPSPEWNGCTTSTPSAFVAGTRAHGRPVKRTCTSCTDRLVAEAKPQLRAGRNLDGILHHIRLTAEQQPLRRPDAGDGAAWRAPRHRAVFGAVSIFPRDGRAKAESQRAGSRARGRGEKIAGEAPRDG